MMSPLPRRREMGPGAPLPTSPRGAGAPRSSFFWGTGGEPEMPFIRACAAPAATLAV